MRAERPSRADLWLSQESPDAEILVVGVPNSKTSGSRADLSPLLLREHLARFSTFESGLDSVPVRDLGNWAVSQLGPDALPEMLTRFAAGMPDARLKVFLGGDGAVTSPLAAAMADDPAEVGVIGFGHGVPGMDDGNLVLVGAHPFASPASGSAIGLHQVDDEGPAQAVDQALKTLEQHDALYLHIDLGVLDPAFAPGSPDARPGGMTVRELATGARLCTRNPKVRCLGLVGVDPELDPGGTTLDAAAYVLLSALAGFAER